MGLAGKLVSPAEVSTLGNWVRFHGSQTELIMNGLVKCSGRMPTYYQLGYLRSLSLKCIYSLKKIFF